MKKILFSCAAAVLMSTGAASAATMSCTSSTTFSLTDALQAACFSGNDTNYITNSTDIFGTTGWMLADKNDDAVSGDQSITFTSGPLNGTKSGSWSISSLPDDALVMINLKSGNGWGSFLVDSMSGIWAADKNLSHASIYYADVAPVPLPAGGLLLLTGMAALGLRRRSKS